MKDSPEAQPQLEKKKREKPACKPTDQKAFSYQKYFLVKQIKLRYPINTVKV
jgi:hypothetical protein